MSDPIAEIKALAAQISALQQQAKALGMFANDRELLKCPRCGLMEDVTHEGLLITCRETDPGQDTGLRFDKITAESFRCPFCGQTVNEPLSEDEQTDGLTA